MPGRRRIPIVATVVAGTIVAGTAYASFLSGAAPLSPGGGSVAISGTSASPGTLLASKSSPFSFTTSAGITSGTVISAVYRNSSGTVDFYYQIKNDATSATSLARATADTFFGAALAVAFRTDGSSLPGGAGFVNGTDGVVPVTADEDPSGAGVGFNFFPLPPGTKIPPGTISAVLIISTSVTFFGSGDFTIADGGGQTVASYGLPAD